MTKTILIKVGTAVLTTSEGKLDLNLIRSLVDQISELKKNGYKVVLVTSGAVGAGLELNKFSSVKNKVIRKQMLAAVGQNYLMQIYSKYFKTHDVIIAQALLSRSDFSIREKYLNMQNTLLNLLDQSVVPIINENDVVSTEELSFGDNDILASYTAALIKADKLIILTVVDGLYDKDPSDKTAKTIEKVAKITNETFGMCGKSKSSLGSGGMKSKISAANISMELGIEMIIANGKTQNLKDIVEGKFKGTTFTPENSKKKSVYSWLIAGSAIAGHLTIDDGAAKAIVNHKSLLIVGIEKIEGNFKEGDTVEVCNNEGERIAVGIINFSSEALVKILSQPKGKEPLKNQKEVIHCDNLKIL